MKRKAFAVGVRLKPQETSVIIMMFSTEPPEQGFNNLSRAPKLHAYIALQSEELKENAVLSAPTRQNFCQLPRDFIIALCSRHDTHLHQSLRIALNTGCRQPSELLLMPLHRGEGST